MLPVSFCIMTVRIVRIVSRYRQANVAIHFSYPEKLANLSGKDLPLKMILSPESGRGWASMDEGCWGTRASSRQIRAAFLDLHDRQVIARQGACPVDRVVAADSLDNHRIRAHALNRRVAWGRRRQLGSSSMIQPAAV